MSAAETPRTPTRRRVPWDSYRKISAWMGLLAFVGVILIVVSVGAQLGLGSGEPQAPATTWTIIGLLAGPAVLAGIVSGSRFYALYSGYAARLEPTAPLSPEDATRGASAVSGFIGDGLWGSLIAGVAGGIPGTLAFATLVGPFAVIMLPVFVLVGGIAWFTGWVAGAVASMIISAAIGIAVGGAKNPKTKTRLPWILVAAFLPVLLAVVSLAAAVRFPGDRTDIPSGLLYLLGLPLDAEFVLGEPLLVVARVLAWLGIALVVVLVTVSLPSFVHRRGATGRSAVEDASVPPVPRA